MQPMHALVLLGLVALLPAVLSAATNKMPFKCYTCVANSQAKCKDTFNTTLSSELLKECTSDSFSCYKQFVDKEIRRGCSITKDECPDVSKENEAKSGMHTTWCYTCEGSACNTGNQLHATSQFLLVASFTALLGLFGLIARQ
jgi:hypothetical protein